MDEPQKPKSSKDDLGIRIRSAQARRAGVEAKKRRASDQRGLAFGLRVGVDLVAGIGLGVGVGVFLDRWLDSAPLFLLLFFLLGTAAGFLNVFRTIRGYGYAIGYRQEDTGDEPPRKGDDSGSATGSSDKEPRDRTGQRR